MKPTDFSYHLSKFMTDYLAGQRNLSTNTIKSYRDTFILLFGFLNNNHHLPIEKISIQKINKPLVEEFLNWLETKRNNSISTRNQRLAALHSFFRYLQGEKPEYLFHCQKIISIPFKRGRKATIKYLSDKSMKIILSSPDKNTPSGRRDLTLLSTLYDTGTRVQELADLKVRDVRLETPAILNIKGKGRKNRHVPILNQTKNLLRQYLKEQKLMTNDKLDHPLFFNKQRKKLTRQGVTYILKKHASEVSLDNITPHILRHTKAMHLLQAGINLVYIRDFLGHSELATTEIYARADTEMKRAALEKVKNNVIPKNISNWQENQDLMDWLNKLC